MHWGFSHPSIVLVSGWKLAQGSSLDHVRKMNELVPGIPEEVPIYFLSKNRRLAIENVAHTIVYEHQGLLYNYISDTEFTIKTDHKPSIRLRQI